LNYYYDINTYVQLGEKINIEDEDSYFYNKDTDMLFFTDVGFLLKMGFKNIKLSTQFSTIFNFNSENIQYKKFNFNLGISFSFNIF